MSKNNGRYTIYVNVDEVAFRVAMARKLTNISQLAEWTGITRQTIKKWVRLGVAPIEGAVHVSYSLGCTIEEAFGFQENMDEIRSYATMVAETIR